MWTLLDKRMKGKANSNWLKDNKDNINKNWRPKKWVSLFLHQCKEADIVEVSKQDIEQTYLSLINMSASELEKVWTDTVQPLVVRKLAQFITKAKDIDIIEKMLDRWIWKATQKEEVKHTWEISIKDITIQ